ncbi:MAG: APC family permease [Holophaga sp.]|jgi:amino acid transporter
MTTQPRSRLGLWSIVLLGVNGIIGSGIFLLPGKAMQLMGPGSIFVYLFMAVLIMALTLCFAECAGRFERNGAAYVYAREAFGKFVGFEVGVMSWAIRIIAWAAMPVGFCTALSAVWPQALMQPYRTIIILVIFLGLTTLNLLGVKPVNVVNVVVTCAKVLPLLFFIGVGVWFIEGAKFHPMFPPGAGGDAFGTAALVIFYAYTGFEALAVAAEDMGDPRRTLPLALMISMLFCAAVYFMVQAIAVGTLGPALAKSVAPVADSANVFMGGAGKWLVTVGTLISIFGINVVSSFVAPRAGVALAEDRIVPHKLADLNRFGAPWGSCLVVIVIAIPLALTGSFVQLAAISVVSRFAQYLPTCLAVPVLRRWRKDLPVGFRVPFGPVIPVVAAVVSIWLLTKATSVQLMWGLGALVIGVPLFFLMLYLNRKQSAGTPEVREAHQ